jgi:hypothetical protein
MECHPCYQWLLKVVSPYLARWPDVDVDVKQKFQFGGIGALFGYEIDLLVTPDPLYKPGLRFEPVFDYEQVLVVSRDHPLAGVAYVKPEQLTKEVLITYPVAIDRLDIYNAVPDAGRHHAAAPQVHRDDRHHAADGRQRPRRRGAAALAGPRNTPTRCPWCRCAWAARHRQADLPGLPRADVDIDYLKAFDRAGGELYYGVASSDEQDASTSTSPDVNAASSS